MSANIIDGKALAQNIYENLQAQIYAMKRAPRLDIVLMGNDDASEIYVRNKMKSAEKIGLKTVLHRLNKNDTEADLLALIDKLNVDSGVDGIIVQLPLPEQINTHNIINRISPQKDVDGFHPVNTGMLQNNEEPYFVAATPLGIMRLLQTVCTDLSGKNVVIIGASLIVGRPLATLLLNQECTVTITHIHTQNIKELTQKADIVVAACGVANMVKADWIKEGAVLIDVGINRCDGKICGDIDFAAVQNKAGAITPVPGGVGPMTVAMLLQNTIRAYMQQHG
ncbi:MAG: bifunctional 5,10-methylenetetrahydrofolate dehydrogenase/5,10-methenyltetrahydrofolate cyclohydrolase [Alphaproteobacteria bacterium]|nr:bifunctional 5,10-methylenetetrahydrofolate dehydrogenase/5,10-methenyltetrahydrofolate cyclohydrolase [Alphaproteobacteria bacterium]